jgi:hypothetical protein
VSNRENQGRVSLADLVFRRGQTQVIGELSKLRGEFAWLDEVVQVVDVDPVSLM